MDHFSPFEEARENQPGQSENMGAHSTYTGWNFNFHLPISQLPGITNTQLYESSIEY